MVQLIPMTETEFQMYRKRSVAEYAQEHVQAGNWHPSIALKNAERQFMGLLPKGLASKNQHLFSIQDAQNGLKVGILWFAVDDSVPQPFVFIFDFWIDETYRRQGYASQTLKVLEEKVLEMGIETIKLHAFAHNQAAVSLYQNAGFEVTDLSMAKKLGA